MLVGGAALGFCLSGFVISVALFSYFSDTPAPGGSMPAVPAIISFTVAAAAVCGLVYVILKRTQAARLFLSGLLLGLCAVALLEGACFYAGTPRIGG